MPIFLTLQPIFCFIYIFFKAFVPKSLLIKDQLQYPSYKSKDNQLQHQQVKPHMFLLSIKLINLLFITLLFQLSTTSYSYQSSTFFYTYPDATLFSTKLYMTIGQCPQQNLIIAYLYPSTIQFFEYANSYWTTKNTFTFSVAAHNAPTIRLLKIIPNTDCTTIFTVFDDNSFTINTYINEVFTFNATQQRMYNFTDSSPNGKYYIKHYYGNSFFKATHFYLKTLDNNSTNISYSGNFYYLDYYYYWTQNNIFFPYFTADNSKVYIFQFYSSTSQFSTVPLPSISQMDLTTSNITLSSILAQLNFKTKSAYNVPQTDYYSQQIISNQAVLFCFGSYQILVVALISGSWVTTQNVRLISSLTNQNFTISKNGYYILKYSSSGKADLFTFDYYNYCYILSLQFQLDTKIISASVLNDGTVIGVNTFGLFSRKLQSIVDSSTDQSNMTEYDWQIVISFGFVLSALAFLCAGVLINDLIGNMLHPHKHYHIQSSKQDINEENKTIDLNESGQHEFPVKQR